ncbi:hypothetical protein SADUNF_Sadunf11G0094700 [Salix dunnii]|uniref:mRNA cap guanine-N(7) methyltransferase 1 n=1 Tax=Salix dunnii TaxID=1413687 RepID=A0A835MNB9_9ROSI|nr:hypothetical protein SADUNF_Sadunf11G0094700 [Salix dunnii]
MKRGYPTSPSNSSASGPPKSRLKYTPEVIGDLIASHLIAGDVLGLGAKMRMQLLYGARPLIVFIFLIGLIGEADFSSDFVQRVADHYSSRTNQTLEQREASPIIHLKKLNNWIKSVLVQQYTTKGDAVLDLACGKELSSVVISVLQGGDLIKWDKAKAGYYVGIDIAEGSVYAMQYEMEDCRTRYNGDADHHQRRKKFTFPARLICGDCFELQLDEVLADDAPFDIVSCQFALHYSWSTEARARRALANISALLRPGGTFIGTMPDANVIIKKLREEDSFSCEYAAEGLAYGNSVYWVRFEEEFSQKKFKSSSPYGIKYYFHLEDAVDCPEWIVPFHVFKTLAEEYGFELIFVKNNHEFVHENMKKPENVELMRRLGALGDGNQDLSTLSPDEWEVAYLYLAFVLKKASISRGQPDRMPVKSKRDKGKMHLEKEDILYISSEV